MESCFCCKKEYPAVNMRKLKYMGSSEITEHNVCQKCDHTEEGKLLRAMHKRPEKKDAKPSHDA